MVFRWCQTARASSKVMIAKLRSDDWQSVLVDECITLGGLYIKFLQVLAVHQTTKHLVTSTRMHQMFEDAPFETIDMQQTLVQAGLQGAFTHFEPQPIAAGSYGQVYRASLEGDRQVVVKILRPSVQQYLGTDLFLLNHVTRLVALFTRGSIIQPHAIFKEFARATRQETNYLREADNGEWLRHYFSDSKNIVIPETHRHFTSKNVLVQDYVPGLSLASVMDQQRHGADIEQLVRDNAKGSDIWMQLFVLGAELLTATLKADYIMADPHPGNVRLLPNNQVALIDFGLVARAPTNRQTFATMIRELRYVYEDGFRPGSFASAMLSFYDDELASALNVTAQTQGVDYVDLLEQFMASQLNKGENKDAVSALLHERLPMMLFMQVVNSRNSLGIRLNEREAILQRSMIMFLSIVRTIGDAHGAKRHFDVIHSALCYVDNQNLSVSNTPRYMSDERAIEITSNWLTTLAECNRSLYGQMMKGIA